MRRVRGVILLERIEWYAKPPVFREPDAVSVSVRWRSPKPNLIIHKLSSDAADWHDRHQTPQGLAATVAGT
jgi:hypothetical protein